MPLLSSLVKLKGLCPIVLGLREGSKSLFSLCLLLSIPSASQGTALGQLPAPLLENAPEICCASAGVSLQTFHRLCRSRKSPNPGPKIHPLQSPALQTDYLKCREIYFQLHPGISLCLEAQREQGETFPQGFELICGNDNLILQLQDPKPISSSLGYEFLPTPGAPEPPWHCHSCHICTSSSSASQDQPLDPRLPSLTPSCISCIPEVPAAKARNSLPIS